MKKSINKIGALIIFCVLVFASCSRQHVELKLPNSNKVVVKLSFKNGSISDPQGKEGLTTATASLMAQGAAGEMEYGEIQDLLYPWAAEYGANVDKEVTVFTFQVPADFQNEFYPVIRDVILHPQFNENDFKRVMTNQQNYVDQTIRASSDEVYSKKALEDLLFRNTNYQHMDQGKSASVKQITLDDIKNHYKTFFTRNNVLIGIAGNYSEDFYKNLQSDIQKLPDTQAPIPQPGKARMPHGIEVEIIAKEGAFGSAIFTGVPLPVTRANNDFAALMVANSWIGEHRKSYSRLYQKIREARSMNYGDYAYIEWYENGESFQLPPSGVPRSSNYWSIWIRPVQIASQLKQQYEELADIEVGHGHFALRMAIREFDLLIKNGLTKEAFEDTRTFLRSYIKLYAQTPQAQLGWLMDSKFYGRDNYLSELDALLAKVTLDDVNKAIKKYWQTDNMFVTIVTDISEAEPLAKSLIDNLPSPMSYSDLVKSGLSEEILKEDEEVANYKLNVKSVVVVRSEDTFK